MPGVHRVASLLKRWLLGTHQGAQLLGDAIEAARAEDDAPRQARGFEGPDPGSSLA